MSYVVVIRSEKDDAVRAVHRGADLPLLLDRLKRRYAPRRIARWHGEATDQFIRMHYKVDMSASWIAQILTAKRKRKITKNMVISRARALGLGEPVGRDRS